MVATGECCYLCHSKTGEGLVKAILADLYPKLSDPVLQTISESHAKQ
jgi:hypothetical protein